VDGGATGGAVDARFIAVIDTALESPPSQMSRLSPSGVRALATRELMRRSSFDKSRR